MQNKNTTETNIPTITDVYDLLEKMTDNLIELHRDSGEYDNNHGDDADHEGEAPEACAYCEDIVKARTLLESLGRKDCCPV